MKATLGNLHKVSNDAIMHCTVCGGEYSANYSDYFMLTDPKHEFKCCSKVMELVIKQTIYASISK